MTDDETITSPEAQATLLIGPPRLTIRKRAVTPGPYFCGSAVRYEYVVTNTGPRALHDVVVMDSHVARISCDRTTLAPRQSTVCHGTYRIRDVDARAGHVTNSAQASGIDSRGNIFMSRFVTATIRIAKRVPVTG